MRKFYGEQICDYDSKYYRECIINEQKKRKTICTLTTFCFLLTIANLFATASTGFEALTAADMTLNALPPS